MGATLFVLLLGTNLPSPLWQLYEQRFGFGPATVTVLFALYAIALVPTILVAGPLADTLGGRLVVAPALLIAAAGCLLLASATSLTALIIGRLAQGVAVGATSGALTAALHATEPDADQRRAALLATFATTAGAGSGPVLAGALAAYGPRSASAAYMIDVALLAAALTIGLPALPPAPPRTARARYRPRRPHLPAANRTLFLRACGLSALAWAVAYVVLALAPSYATQLLHTDNRLAAGAPAGLLLLTAALTQTLRSTMQPAAATRTGLLAMIAGLLGLIVVAHLPSVLLLILVLVVIGAGQGLTFMGALRQASVLVQPSEPASTAALFFSITYLGGTAPVLAVGALTLAMPLTTAVQLFTGATILTAALIVTRPRRRR